MLIPEDFKQPPIIHESLRTPSLMQMQYSFIYQALLEHYLYGDTELDVSSLEGHLHRLHSTHIHMDRVGLEEEFRVNRYICCFFQWLWYIFKVHLSFLMEGTACYVGLLFFCRNWPMFVSWRKTWGLVIFRPTWGRTEYFRLFLVRKLFYITATVLY